MKKHSNHPALWHYYKTQKFRKSPKIPGFRISVSASESASESIQNLINAHYWVGCSIHLLDSESLLLLLNLGFCFYTRFWIHPKPHKSLFPSPGFRISASASDSRTTSESKTHKNKSSESNCCCFCFPPSPSLSPFRSRRTQREKSIKSLVAC